MIKYFENGNKEKLKLVLEEVYKVKDIDKMSDNELTYCYIAKTLERLENFCEIAESAETDLDYRVKKLEKKLKKLKKG